jgi:hypothetical protein
MFGPDPHSSLPTVLETGRSSILDDTKWTERDRELARDRERERERERSRRDGLGRRNSQARDNGKRASWGPAPDSTLFAPSPSVSHKRASWAPPDNDAEDFDDWRGRDFELFSDVSTTGVPPAPAPPSPNPAVASTPLPERERSPSPPPSGVTMKDLPVSLEDVFHGAIMLVRFKRRGAPVTPSSSTERLGVDARGRQSDRARMEVTEDVKLKVTIPRGLEPGSKLKYAGQGDWVDESGSKGRRGDLWFRLVEKQDDVFERRHLDLHARIELTVQEALCGGWTRSVRTVCGRDIRVGPDMDPHAVGEAAGSTVPVTGEGWRVQVKGMGMVKYQREGAQSEREERGDMIVETRVVWPERLELWQRDLILQALGGSSRK